MVVTGSGLRLNTSPIENYRYIMASGRTVGDVCFTAYLVIVLS